MNIFDHKVLYVGCERMPGFTSARISLDLKKFSINILKCIFLQFWWKLNTRRIVKTCPFRFMCDCYGDSLDVIFLQFPNHFLPFPMVFFPCFPWCSYDFLRCFYCFPSAFPQFPNLDFANLVTDIRQNYASVLFYHFCGT